jgi:hypothetical protein
MGRNEFMEHLRQRAAEDARKFREQHPDDTPNERWIENSFTAAVPIVADDAGVIAGAGPHPQLFAVYASEIARVLGMDAIRESGEWDRRSDTTQVQEPTRGEG